MLRQSLAARRGLAVALFGLTGLALSAVPARADAPAEKTLPASTVAFLKIENAAQFREAAKGSQIGQLLADPALKPLREDVASKLEDFDKQVRARLGLPLAEVLTLPEGAVSLAVIPVADQKAPVAFLVSADAGKNASAMQGVMTKGTDLAKEDGKAKVTSEDFKGQKLTVITGDDDDAPPLAWVQNGTVFHIATGAETLKDALANADGREESLDSVEAFQTIREKTGPDAQVVWFLNLSEALKLVTKTVEAQGAGAAAQIEAQLQLTGLSGLKAIGGSLAVNSGQYDTISRVFLSTPDESQGLLRLFTMPKAKLRPEPWVPDTVASYQTISWDLDSAYKAATDLADMLAPGVLAALEQQLGGPDGGGIKFERDLFGPLGDRITIISDFKKPVTEDSQRLLIAVSLEDAKAFQNTLGKVLKLANAQPKTREFQGSTVYDFDVPEIPNAEQANLPEAISLTIAKDHLFVASDSAFLEQILRGGAAGLADSPDFQAIAKAYPETSSSLSFQRAEEQARVSYEMIKSGQFEAAIKESARNAGNNDVEVPQIIDPAKLPDFSVFAKYLSAGGGYSQMDKDGVSYTTFSLKKATP